MMERQDLAEWIALQAIEQWEQPGAAESAWLDTPEITPEMNSEITAELAQLQAVVASLAYSAPLMPMASDLKQRLMQRIATQDFDLEQLKQQATAVDWQPYAHAAQTMVGTWRIDNQQREVQCFVRAVGAVQFPRHRHAQTEEIIVLEGDMEIDGHVYQSGDRIASTAGTEHQPVTQQGCLLFLRTSIDDEIFV